MEPAPESTSSAPLTLEEYVNQYKGQGRLLRLATIAEKQEPYRVDALKLMISIAKKEKNYQ